MMMFKCTPKPTVMGADKSLARLLEEYGMNPQQVSAHGVSVFFSDDFSQIVGFIRVYTGDAPMIEQFIKQQVEVPTLDYLEMFHEDPWVDRAQTGLIRLPFAITLRTDAECMEVVQKLDPTEWSFEMMGTLEDNHEKDFMRYLLREARQ